MVFPVWLLDGGTVFGIHQHERPAPDERFRIVTAPYGLGLSFRDPDGIALEFFAPPG
jgi:hypothetical protein